MLLDFLVLAILVAPVPATIACGYLWWVYERDKRRPRSWLFRMLSITATVVTIGAGYFGFLAADRLTGQVLPSWVLYVSAVIVLMLDAVPVYKAWTIWASRHGDDQPRIQA